MSPGVFHPILVREGRAAQVEVRDFHFVRWADHLYYEVCSNPELIDKDRKPALLVNGGQIHNSTSKF